VRQKKEKCKEKFGTNLLTMPDFKSVFEVYAPCLCSSLEHRQGVHLPLGGREPVGG